jgi:hypothetical protein
MQKEGTVFGCCSSKMQELYDGACMANRFAQARAWSSEFRQIVTNLSVKSGCRLEVPSGRDFDGIKDPKRTVEKVCRTYAGRCDQVLDLLRATIVADDLTQMYKAVRLLTHTDEYSSGKIQKANGDDTYDVLFDSGLYADGHPRTGRCDSAVPKSRIRKVGFGHVSRVDLQVGDKVEAQANNFDDRVTVHRIKNKFDDAAEVKGGFRNIHFNLTLKHPCCDSACCCGDEGTGFVCELQIQHRKVSFVVNA